MCNGTSGSSRRGARGMSTQTRGAPIGFDSPHYRKIVLTPLSAVAREERLEGLLAEAAHDVGAVHDERHAAPAEALELGVRRRVLLDVVLEVRDAIPREMRAGFRAVAAPVGGLHDDGQGRRG